MSITKVPRDAFAFYVSLQETRSYDAVARHYGVWKRTITRIAVREKWAERLADIEKKAREEADAALTTDLKNMHLRHRKMLQAIAARAALAIQSQPLNSAMEGVKAAEVAIKLERLVAGEATERTVNVEAIVRDEQRRLLTPLPGDEDNEPESPDEAAEELVEEGGDDEIEDDEGDLDVAASA